MLKILYAASNNENAKIQLSRFIQAMDGKRVTIKVAAYRNSSPPVNIDWTLDCLLNIFKPNHISLDNDNFPIYFQQVKKYKPDLIISDLEYFTSYIAGVLNIPLWQCSSSLINYAILDKYNVGLFNKYSYLLIKNPLQVRRHLNIIDNSDYNFVYSHFGDMNNPPKIKDNFKWVRPYTTVGKISIPCQHNIVSASLSNNQKILSFLKSYKDTISFTESGNERYSNLILKNINNQEEYFCNLKNANLFVCEGQTSFLADAFYNKKYCVVIENQKDLECITNATFSEHFKLSTTVFDNTENLEVFNNTPIQSYDNGIKFLHQYIEEI